MENYYKILGVDPSADINEIKDAYLYKINILHPDRLAHMSERIQKRAEEDIKLVNIAYGVLSDKNKKYIYDRQLFGQKETLSYPSTTSEKSTDPRATIVGKKPKIEIFPKKIVIKNGLPFVAQKVAYYIKNSGGPYSQMLISRELPSWLKISYTKSLYQGSKLPMQVGIEATGIHWGKTYKSEIIARLDDSEKGVKVELRMNKRPRH